MCTRNTYTIPLPPKEEATDQGNAVSGPGGDLTGEEGIDENTTAGDPAVEGEEIPDWSKPGSGTLIFIVMVIALVPFSIVFVNVLGAYHYYGKRQDILEKLLAKNGSTSQDETQSLIKEFISMEPIGVGGVARAAMAIGVIVIVGVAVVFLLVNASEGDRDIVKEILLILCGSLVLGHNVVYPAAEPAKRAHCSTPITDDIESYRE